MRVHHVCANTRVAARTFPQAGAKATLSPTGLNVLGSLLLLWFVAGPPGMSQGRGIPYPGPILAGSAVSLHRPWDPPAGCPFIVSPCAQPVPQFPHQGRCLMSWGRLGL